jgi:xylulokinase
MYISLIEDHFKTSIERVRLMNDDAPSLDDSYDWWNTQRASVWNRPVIEMESRAIAGLLIPATLIASVYSTPQEAKEKLLRRRSVVSPESDIVGVYEQRKREYLQKWREIADVYVKAPGEGTHDLSL